MTLAKMPGKLQFHALEYVTRLPILSWLDVPGIPLNIMSIVYQNVGLVHASLISWTALYKLATFMGSVWIIV